jgi:aspartyl-tRNA synthetase
MLRTHTCGQLTASDIGQTVTLSWWVDTRRDHGGVIFIDLRDRYGTTQTVFDPVTAADAYAIADSARSEYVVTLTGVVRARPEGQTNAKISTGEIEVVIHTAKILTKAHTPPFEISDKTNTSEDIRFKYRYLDLRRPVMRSKIERRAAMNRFSREYFSDRGFLEVQTPIFTSSSPEGARDYLIPSRLHPGKFYALPQAPQQYKQLLMVAGVDKYFQIAPCFRDEDPRADRHSCEFYQIDCEMSFVDQEDIFVVAEDFAKKVSHHMNPEKTIVNLEETGRFRRLTHTQAKDLYGSDKPDIRFDLHFEDVSGIFAETGFTVFAQSLASGGVVKAMKLSGQTLSRSQIDTLTEVARSSGAKGLAYVIYEAEGPKSPILKFLSETEIAALRDQMDAEVGDIVFFGADDRSSVNKALWAVRLALRDMCQLVDSTQLAFCWVTDFPMYEQKEDGSYDFEHNPFSMPHGGAEAFAPGADPLSIYGCQYDLALNGYEILSGSIRNHDLWALIKAFEIVGKGEAEVKEKFGAMYEAFGYGVPPHGGFAFGFDRLFMILSDETNIREMYAFPKSGKAEDAMMRAPSNVDEKQLEELHIDIRSE